MSLLRRAAHSTFCSYRGYSRLHIDLGRVAAALCSA